MVSSCNFESNALTLQVSSRLACLSRIEQWWFVISCWDYYICSILRNNFNQAIRYVMENTNILMFCRLIYFCEANNGMSQRIASVWSIFAFEAFRTINLSECFQAFHCAQNAMLLNSLNCFTLHPICYLVFSCIPLCSLFFWLLLSSPPLWAFWLFLHLSLSCSFIVSDNFLLVNNISLFNFSFIIFNTASKIFSGSGSLHLLFFSLCNSCPFPSSVASSSSFLFLSFFQSEIPNLLGRDFPVVRISVQKHCYNS
jgi:hypothetical protein